MASFWGPITSSVDFCEPNYEGTRFVAEPANAASSLILVWVGLAGLVGARRRERQSPGGRWHDLSFACLYGTLAAVGAGSVMLHLTLTAWGQALDEIPMLLLALFILAALLELPAAEQGLARPWLPAATLAACAAAVAVYTTFREFYGVFLLCYISCVVVIVLRLGSLALRPRSSPGPEAIRVGFIRPFFLGGVAAYIGCGSVAWVFDFLLCDAVSSALGPLLGTAFLHPLWHVGAGVGTFLAIQVLAAARAEAIGARPVLRWAAGALPFVAYKYEDEGETGEKGGGAVPLVLICGPSGCGKSSLAKSLAAALSSSCSSASSSSSSSSSSSVGGCTVVSQDAYFTQSFESYEGRTDDRFEGPAHVDWAAVRRDVARARRQPPHRPSSPFPRRSPRRHAATDERERPEEGGRAAAFVVLEGHVAATDGPLAAAASFAVIFSGSEDTCRARRLGRRARPEKENRVLENYIRTVSHPKSRASMQQSPTHPSIYSFIHSFVGSFSQFVWPAFLKYGKPAQDALEERLLRPQRQHERQPPRVVRVPADDRRTPEQLARDVLRAMSAASILLPTN